jgi:hypothetical protein
VWLCAGAGQGRHHLNINHLLTLPHSPRPPSVVRVCLTMLPLPPPMSLLWLDMRATRTRKVCELRSEGRCYRGGSGAVAMHSPHAQPCASRYACVAERSARFDTHCVGSTCSRA